MRIAQVSEQYRLSTDTLRYYERIGLIPPVRRDENGIRDYEEIDLRRVEFIKCMRSAGLPVEQLAQYVQLFPQGDATVEARKQILQDQREQIAARIAELQRTLDLLDGKIAMYESCLIPTERKLLQVEISDPGEETKTE